MLLEIDFEFSKVLFEKRKELDLSQDELAKKLGICRQVLIKVEKNKDTVRCQEEIYETMKSFLNNEVKVASILKAREIKKLKIQIESYNSQIFNLLEDKEKVKIRLSQIESENV